jgi:hypothetical protein
MLIRQRAEARKKAASASVDVNNTDTEKDE